MPGQKFEDGSAVMGRWPGSSLYYEVQIVSFDPLSQLYTVRYKDGTELDLKEGDMKALSAFRKKGSSASPSRRRSRSRSRSPARIRSPGRTPKKSQQPSPVPVARDSRKGDLLKVQLTPLRLEDFISGKSNGEAEGIGKTVDFLRENLRTTVEKDDYLREPLRSNVEREDFFRESLPSNVEREEKVVKELVKNERVLRYRRKKEDHVEKESNYTEVDKAKPAEEIQSEFGGTIGTFFMTLSMPPLLYYLLNQCIQKNASLFSFYPQWSLADLWNPTVLGYFALWMLLNALFYLLPIGKVAYGVPLANGKQLKYRINGIHSLLLVSVMAAVLLYYQVNLLYVYNHLHQFAAAATLFSVVLSVYAFARSYRAPKEDLSEAGKSGNFIYTFFMGRELNPHIGNFDLKYFIAIQPAINGWVFLNIIMILAEMHVQNLDVPSVSMILVNSCQLLYVLHALWNQEGMLTSLDIAYDGFGFMMAFGGLVWVPFTYALQAIYLVNHPVDLSCTVVASIIALNTLGYLLFRYANNQKFAFRKNPDDPKLSHLKTIPTSAGSQLIVSGLWGWVRHPNYLGDLIMAWAWCLHCGFASILPYFYGFFLTDLLLHRVTRVEQQCKRKYGPDWQKYCQHVPYRLVPYIY
ncbi:PREDICTED: lamin-B receptor [Nanorana parkeri]|uniref:lamin-B receptor n=1 Tax=Nanorana parkeri TaxID=125878 RepID=UPI000854441B|nr:PREDICTED: lamin-B receptor [Nanorana parkeri]